MTPEEKSLLERTYKMAEENNTILRKMRRSAWITNVMRVLYWVVILIVSYGAYYFIQPYVNLLMDTINQVQSTTTTANNSLQALKNLDALKALLPK